MGKNTELLRKQLSDAQRLAQEHLAAQIHQYHFADARIGGASVDKLGGSGVILTLTALGGREIISPVMIRGGLSNETVEALRADFRRSYLDATVFKPKGVA